VICISLSTLVGYKTKYETKEYQFLVASFQKKFAVFQCYKTHVLEPRM